MSTHNPPLKPLPLFRANSMQFSVFYTKEGEIRDKFIPLCEELKIPTKDLLIKSLQDFAGLNISDKVQTQKFNQYESNRVSKLEFLRTLSLERKLIKAKKDKEVNIMEPKSYRSQGVTPRGSMDYRVEYSPSLMNTPSNQYLDQMRQDGNRSVAEKKLNFFFTELPDTITGTGSQTNRMRDYVNEALTPMSLSLEKKKTRQYVTFDKLSTSRKGEKTTRTSRNSSLEQEGFNTKNKFMQNFDKALEERIKKSERMFNASASLLRQQDENRSRLNDMWAKKEEKWQNAMKSLEVKKKGKVSKIEEIQRTRSEKRLELHQADEQRRRDKHKMMIRKMDEAGQKMEDFQEDRLKRIMEFNKPYRERQSSYMGKKIAREEAQIPLLSDIEDRLLVSSMRKQRAISTRSRGTPWFEIEEKQKKAKDLEESTKEKTLQKFVEKMVKKKSAFEIHDMIKNRYNSSPRLDKKLEHTARVDAIRAQDVEKVKEKVKETQERLANGARRVERHKMEMVEFYKEKREINMYRTEAAKFNKQLVVEADERKTDFRVSMYKDKLRQIETEKLQMNKRRERVFELTRNLFERRPGGSLGKGSV